MKKFLKMVLYVIALSLLTMSLAACSGSSPATETGSLVFTANGEEFIREGFLSKDGWKLTFDHAYVSLSELTAYITNPAYDVAQGWDINAVESVTLPGSYVVDLAAADADPVVLGQLDNVPAGHYNASSWTMARATQGPTFGYILVLVGSAFKDGEEISFILRFDDELLYRGGEYIGDERKGIVTAGNTANVEATFHFDHLFGDGEEEPDNEINLKALGFAPFAALAENNSLELSAADFQQKDPEAYEQLRSIYLHLAHVGEGHCLARFR